MRVLMSNYGGDDHGHKYKTTFYKSSTPSSSTAVVVVVILFMEIQFIFDLFDVIQSFNLCMMYKPR